MNLKVAALVATGLVAMALTGCSASHSDPPAPAPAVSATPAASGADGAFDAYLVENAPDMAGLETPAQGSGRAFCGLLKAHMSFDNAVASTTSQLTPSLTTHDVAVLILDSVTNYCPQYNADLTSYLGN